MTPHSSNQRRRLLHALVPTLHTWAEVPEPGLDYVQCRSCGAARAARVDVGCVFCHPDKIANPIEYRTSAGGHSMMVFEPIEPVTKGHQMVVPAVHVRDAVADPAMAGEVVAVAALVAARWPSANIVTSVGESSTQDVSHLHAHVVPRREGDDLPLPISRI